MSNSVIRYRLKREKRLRLKKEISVLFSSGNSLYISPIRLVWKVIPSCNTIPLKVLVSVPRHNIRKATDRNKIRRRIKEIYRLNKHPLAGVMLAAEKVCLIAWVYTGRKVVDSKELKPAILLLLRRLTDIHAKASH